MNRNTAKISVNRVFENGSCKKMVNKTIREFSKMKAYGIIKKV